MKAIVDRPAVVDISIRDITLLTVEEAKKVDRRILFQEGYYYSNWNAGYRWWLRTPGKKRQHIMCVDGVHGIIIDDGKESDHYYGVRPVLQVADIHLSNLGVGDIVEVAGEAWTVISNDLILCNGYIGYTGFRKDYEAEDASDYEKSEIKKWLHNWAAENGIEFSGKNAANSMESQPQVEVEDIMLLSAEEAKKLDLNILKYRDWWWLRSPGNVSSPSAAFVGFDGSVDVYGTCVSFTQVGIRPALRISNPKSANLQLGDKIIVAGEEWTMISDDLLLCDEVVDHGPFRKDSEADDATDYEASDVKKQLHNWAAEKGIEFTKE